MFHKNVVCILRASPEDRIWPECSDEFTTEIKHFVIEALTVAYKHISFEYKTKSDR